MATYQGEVIVVFTTAKDPITGDPITDLAGEVNFYAPGKNPARVVEDRTVDKGPFAVSFDVERGGYVAFVPTVDWTPGKWSYRVDLAGGAFENWEYGAVSIKV